MSGSRRRDPLRLRDDGVRLAARLRASFTPAENVVLFTGPGGADGVTTVATQVSAAFAHMNEGAVLLVDVNLRRPAVHTVFDIDQVPGLSELIMKKADPEAAIRVSATPSLSVLPAGSHLVEPLSLLVSAGCVDLMQELRRVFRFVVLDAPPILRFADTALIAPQADGVVLVLAAGRRRRSEVREVKRVLDGVKVRLVGVALSDPGGSVVRRLSKRPG